MLPKIHLFQMNAPKNIAGNYVLSSFWCFFVRQITRKFCKLQLAGPANQLCIANCHVAECTSTLAVSSGHIFSASCMNNLVLMPPIPSHLMETTAQPPNKRSCIALLFSITGDVFFFSFLYYWRMEMHSQLHII